MRVRLDWAFKPVGAIRDLRLRRRGRWILLSAVIGAAAGLGAILFDLMFRLSQAVLLGGIGRFQPPGAGSEGGPGYAPEMPWLLPLSLVAGGIISGALVFGFAPEAEGHGTDAVIRAYHHLRGKIRKRVPLIKSIASAITIGSGGSAGREGPIAQIGAGFGSYLGGLFKLTAHDRRIMMMAGTAGGIGSIFRAPLGAALFSAECLYSKPEFEYEVLLPGLISSITGYSIYASYAGWEVLFDVPKIAFHRPSELVVYVLLGVLCAVAGAVYPTVFYGTRDRIFHRLPLPPWLKPAVGALALGLIAVAFPQALGMGYGYIQEAMDGAKSIGFLLAFAAIKMVATSLTISSGGSGGVFGPSLVIGGALGAAFGQAAAQYLPGLAPEPAACLLVGMGGFFAGVAKVPFASVIMVMELTGSYGLLVPSLLVATIAYLALPLNVRLYENQVPTRHDSPAHLGSFAVDVLRQVRVNECWSPSEDMTMFREGDTLDRMMAATENTTQDVFPVVDAAGRLQGEISLDDLRRAILEELPPSLVVAKDLSQAPIGVLLESDNLATAARLMAGRHSHSLLVTGGRSDREVRGVFRRRDLIAAYGQALHRLRESGDDGAPGESEPF